MRGGCGVRQSLAPSPLPLVLAASDADGGGSGALGVEAGMDILRCVADVAAIFPYVFSFKQVYAYMFYVFFFLGGGY